ncbi:hypothetical protein EZV62_003448 [Acer yangbiense]|uniref:Glycylpeptide N-tetradecanoyltransferase n=1 Tax=Acer yangbiense TaxID=1000413 RepID=A0A5C7IGW4_9ROSI|nr:hypothetical protein EZV62_003448 [Acer yangbiense]
MSSSDARDINLTPRAFAKMEKLRLLEFYVSTGVWHNRGIKVHAFEGLESVFTELKYLHWYGFPLKLWQPNFQSKNLVILEMPNSNVEELWSGFMKLDSLKRIDLTRSHQLIRCPDLSGTPNLESLILAECTSLSKIPSSIQHLAKLESLDLYKCESLTSIPNCSGLKSLKELILRYCSELKRLPELPNNLETFGIVGCKRLVEIPSSFKYLNKVKYLDLSGCESLTIIPDLRGWKSLTQISGRGRSFEDSFEMVDSNESSGTPDGIASSENDLTLDELTRQVQELLALGNRHKFWETQPVGQFKDVGDSSLPDGPIEPPTPLSEVCTDVYNLLTDNYAEDDENMFRFNYSKEFLRWALRPPGYFQSWHIGVRVKSSKKLVAFITGVPARIRVHDEIVLMAEVNFLCVHKKLRSKRLAPVMIKEVTRRVHLENIWQAAYTAGVVLPTPMSTCQYWHRSLNPKKPIDVGFSRLGARMTMSRTIKLFKLPDSTATPGFRNMELHDVPAVTRLLRNYLSQFIVAPDFDENDVEHWLLPKEDVVDSFLVESPETHEITDFCSFYTLPPSILGNPNYSTLEVAYSYYNVSTKTPLLQLMNDVLIVAKQKDFDVFNALDVMQNETFVKELKFGPGDGKLHYYLYNYRIKHALRSSELGLVLL